MDNPSVQQQITNVNNYFDSVFKDVNISEQEKKQLLGVYLISIYKILIEILLTFKGNDKVFLQKLNELIGQGIDNLEPQLKNAFDKAIEEQKSKIIDTITKIILEKSPKEVAQKIQSNLNGLRQTTTV
jgi:hypothetical protein